MNRLVLFLGLMVGGAVWCCAPVATAQGNHVPMATDRTVDEPELLKAAAALRDAKALLSIEQVQSQLGRRTCVLKLPKPETKTLAGRQIWERARRAYVRVGWFYLCRKCNAWHLDLAGGFYLTADGVVATAHHVAQPTKDMREGYLVVVAGGRVLPVTELLAGNDAGDTCLLRTRGATQVRPLPLNTNVYPGDAAWCYSDPLDHASYFSAGVVNRFLVTTNHGQRLTRIDVSTDWAPGSSGSAVLDECGNAIGLVSEIEVETGPLETDDRRRRRGRREEPLMTLHHAARAAEILALIKPGAE
jgi:hypothetical protein